MSEKEQILLKIKNSIKGIDSNAEIILFGSRARGNNTDISDWDILVLIDNNDTDDVEDKFRNYLYDIELETGQIISALVYSKNYWFTRLRYSPLFYNISKDGIHL